MPATADTLPAVTDAAPLSTVAAFRALGVTEPLCRALERLGITTPTEIQTRAIPELLSGKDVMGKAQTGTGKTAAFGIPLLQCLDMADPRVQGLVLAPTRELAVQVTVAIEEMAQMGPNPGVLAIYGGDSMSRQLHALHRGVRILVATPGRLLDHLNRGSVDLTGVKLAVLDEADEMLKMGFLDDVGNILSQTNPKRQTALFSATVPYEVRRVAEEYQRNPVNIEVLTDTRTASTVTQTYTIAEPMQRAEAVARLLEVEPFEAALVFARTKAGCDELTDALQRRGVPCEALHGDLAQQAREMVIRRLREGRLKVVVATDVAARGLDVPSLDLVVTVELPGHLETYVHRIGRTGRAGRTGKAILVLGPRDERKLRGLERFVGQPLPFQPIPTPMEVEFSRVERFVTDIQAVAKSTDLTPWKQLVARCVSEDVDLESLAAVLARMAAPRDLNPHAAPPPPRASENPMHPVKKEPAAKRADHKPVKGAADVKPEREERPKAVRATPASKSTPDRAPTPDRAQVADRAPAFDRNAPPERSTPQQTRPRVVSLGVGKRNGVTPAMIVACLQREARLPSRMLGAIDIQENYTRIQLPGDVAAQLPEMLRGVLVCGRYLNPRLVEG